uniref:Uncharacterized protein n=1 Tax=Oryza glumipatula TaxID=40148 RepID=A0A0D9YQ54_9ORYZ
MTCMTGSSAWTNTHTWHHETDHKEQEGGAENQLTVQMVWHQSLLAVYIRSVDAKVGYLKVLSQAA